MSARTWRGIRTPKYDQPARPDEVVMTTSSLHRARGEAECDPALHEEEEDHDGNRDQRRGGHDLAPVDEAISAVEVGQPDGDRLLVAAVQQGIREDVFVPARDEGEHRRCD